MANMFDAVPYFEFVQTPGVYTDSNMKAIALALPPLSPSGRSAGYCTQKSARARPNIS